MLTDLDGVLTDSKAAVEEAWRRWAQGVGVDADALIAVAHGVRARETMERFAPHVAVEVEIDALEDLELTLAERWQPIPGAAEFIAALPRHRWAVVTSGGHRLAAARLARVGIDRPEVLIAAEDVAAGKPDPEGYLAGAARLGVAASACLVIEDAPAGIDAARAAGCTVVGVTTTHHARELSAADVVVADPSAVRVTRDASVGLRVEVVAR